MTFNDDVHKTTPVGKRVGTQCRWIRGGESNVPRPVDDAAVQFFPNYFSTIFMVQVDTDICCQGLFI